jgi:hypothetical protein
MNGYLGIGTFLKKFGTAYNISSRNTCTIIYYLIYLLEIILKYYQTY